MAVGRSTPAGFADQNRRNAIIARTKARTANRSKMVTFIYAPPAAAAAVRLARLRFAALSCGFHLASSPSDPAVRATSANP